MWLYVGVQRSYQVTISITVDLVIFAYLNFSELLITGLFTKLRFREFLFLSGSAIIIGPLIFTRFLNSRFVLPAKFMKIKALRILPDL